MAATVELIDGFRYEIAGSVRFPMPSQIANELGLDTLLTIDAEVQSVNLGDEAEEPMIFYRDPMQFMTHLADKHGTDAVTIELRPHSRSDLPDMGTVRAFHSSREIRRHNDKSCGSQVFAQIGSVPSVQSGSARRP
jgi:hypothetical protein